MSNTVYFMNQSFFDKDAMLTFGVSAKEDDTAIGYFGTGFKYAVAIILRLGGSIKVTSGEHVYVFESKVKIIRSQEFDIVECNGQNAGFTTHLGINWKPWMAYRELYANCVDEKGMVKDEPYPFDTVIEVSCNEIYEAFQNTDDYFITGKPIYESKDVDIYEKNSSYVYYRGVAVANTAKFDYGFNIKCHMDLTEERVAMYDFEWKDPIASVIQAMKNSDLLRNILSNESKFVESMSFASYHETSDEFVSMAKTLMVTDIGVPENVRRVVGKLKEKAGDFPPFELNDIQQAMMLRAISFLNTIGITIEDFPVLTVKGLGEGVMGRAIKGKIYLSPIPFNQGTKQLASTLIEEWVHNKHGCKDFDRAMQSWLFDKVLSLGEIIDGSPL